MRPNVFSLWRKPLTRGIYACAWGRGLGKNVDTLGFYLYPKLSLLAAAGGVSESQPGKQADGGVCQATGLHSR